MFANKTRAGVVLAGSVLALTLTAVAQTQTQTPPPAPAGQAGAGAPGLPGRGAPMWEADFSKPGTVPVLSPAEEAKRLWLPPGFKLEPVLSEPDIQEPAQIAFDGNGRMFVLEIRGYMQDADAAGELDPVGRISVHEDKDGDGIYETHHVFVDKLIFPRFVTPFGKNAILTKESNSDEVWKYTDTDGDGVADKKELFATGLGRLLNVEHQESGFVWGMDNWIYSTVNSVRIRWTPTGVLREPTGSNGGQWGVTQDNYGKMMFQAGASGMPGYFQFPVHYGNYTYADQFEPDLTITWGAPVLIADMQGGMNAVRMPDGSLARATGSAGNAVYRGDRLPKDLIGDYFYGEVVARIVRRFRPVKTGGLTQMQNVYPLSEFIRSTDPNFRPVNLKTAPDGTMYIADMYRGIVQESQWSGPGTYLRKRIEQHGLDKIVKHGRIWRLTYEGMGRRTQQPKTLDEAPAQLVEHLKDPNGWWRDTAQQLLVLRQDTSVVPALKAMAKTGDQFARIHAMWTLEWTRRRRRGAGPRPDEGRRSADPHPGASCQRDPLQGGRENPGPGLCGDGERRRHRRGDPGAADDQHDESRGCPDDYAGGAGPQQGPGRAARREHHPQSGGISGPGLRTREPCGDHLYARRTISDGQGQADLRRGLLRLPRRRRPRRPGARPGHARTGPGLFTTRPRTPWSTSSRRSSTG